MSLTAAVESPLDRSAPRCKLLVMTQVIPEDFGVLTFHFSNVEASGEEVVTLGVAIPSSNDLRDTVNHAANAFATNIMPMLTGPTKLEAVSLLARRSGLLEHWDSNEAFPVAGQKGNDELPTSVAYLVQKKTQFAGKRNRGRWYLPGVDASNVGVNKLGGAFIGQFQTALLNFHNAVKLDEGTYSAPMLPVVLHGDTGAPTEIVNFFVEEKVATQRNRLRD
jgi:hypothetical protein